MANDVAAHVEDVALAIRQAGGDALGTVADVSQKHEGHMLFDTALEHLGDVNVVDNACLTNESRHFLEGNEAWWDRMLDTNLKGVLLCADRQHGSWRSVPVP